MSKFMSVISKKDLKPFIYATLIDKPLMYSHSVAYFVNTFKYINQFEDLIL